MNFHVKNKNHIFKKGDSIWISPYMQHGFSGEGSIIKISNGECIDYLDIYEINKIYDYKTGKKSISHSAAMNDLQLSLYQLAIRENYIKNPIFRAAADSARRAVKDSSPLPL